ncbi:MAG TPA: hypothetical protein VF717_06555 [Pyrinomonadaceae bacterium]|jgi:hypothetical protein
MDKDNPSEQEPRAISKAAALLDAKGTAERLGKSLGYVYSMGDNADDDRYTRFLQFYHAVPDAGAELLFRDFIQRHKQRMLKTKPDNEEGIHKTVEDFVATAGRFISALFRRCGSQIVKEGNKLLQMLGTLMSFGRKLQEEEGTADGGGSLRDAAER